MTESCSCLNCGGRWMTTCMIDFPPPSMRRARGSSRGCVATTSLLFRLVKVVRSSQTSHRSSINAKSKEKKKEKNVCWDEPRRRFHSKRFTIVASQRFTQSLSAVSVCHTLLPLSNEDMWPQTHVTSDTHSISQKWKRSNDCHSEASFPLLPHKYLSLMLKICCLSRAESASFR